MARAKKPVGHALDSGETIVAQRDDIAVTSEGRKVRLDSAGNVVERLVGPAYGWESDEDEDAEE